MSVPQKTWSSLSKVYVNPCWRCTNNIWRGRRSRICEKCEEELIHNKTYYYKVVNGRPVPDQEAFSAICDAAKKVKEHHDALYTQLSDEFIRQSSVWRSRLDYLRNLGSLQCCLHDLFMRKRTAEQIKLLEEKFVFIHTAVFSSRQSQLDVLEQENERLRKEERDFRIALACEIPEKQWRYHENVRGAKALSLPPEKPSVDTLAKQDSLLFNLFGAIEGFAENHIEFIRRKRDYKRGNTIDNYIRNYWNEEVIAFYGGKCILCSGTKDLQLDHLWLPKNEGGNFVMLHDASRRLISNIAVLCTLCNAGKSDREISSYLRRLAPETVASIHNIQIKLSMKMMQNEELIQVASEWYGAKIATLADEHGGAIA